MILPELIIWFFSAYCGLIAVLQIASWIQEALYSRKCRRLGIKQYKDNGVVVPFDIK